MNAAASRPVEPAGLAPPAAPGAVGDRDNPVTRGGPAGTLWELAALGCATGGSYVRAVQRHVRRYTVHLAKR